MLYSRKKLSLEAERFVIFKYSVLPGFHDVHQHPLESGDEVGGTCDLPIDQAPDSEDMRAVLEYCASSVPQKGIFEKILDFAFKWKKK